MPNLGALREKWEKGLNVVTEHTLEDGSLVIVLVEEEPIDGYRYHGHCYFYLIDRWYIVIGKEKTFLAEALKWQADQIRADANAQ